jgi:stage III sporulation protein AG
VRQVIPPKYQGAIIVCQGAEKATVRLQVVEAVVNVTGLTADKITVLKMK